MALPRRSLPISRRSEPAAGQSRQSLDRLPGRALTFLRAAATHTGVRAALAAGGYSEADHRRGLELLAAVCADRDADGPEHDAAADRTASRAGTLRESTTRALSVREPRLPREPELLALHHWYADWAATARALIFQKRYLVALGLASAERGDGDAE